MIQLVLYLAKLLSALLKKLGTIEVCWSSVLQPLTLPGEAIPIQSIQQPSFESANKSKTERFECC